MKAVKRILSGIYSACTVPKKAFHRLIFEPLCVARFSTCGRNVRVGYRCTFTHENISIGNNVGINSGAFFLSTKAKIIIGDHVMFGPNVTIVTGDHRTDIPGRLMDSVRDDEKLPDNDQNVVLEGDNWIGANVTILKGVTIGYGSIVASGAVVTKDIPPYSIGGGVPARVIKSRFDESTTNELIQRHSENTGQSNIMEL